MKNVKYFLFSLLCMICSCLVFAKDEVIIKSITPVYDEESTIVVNEDNSVVFNDKDQEVKYNVVIENTMDKDIPIEDITLTKPSESFLLFEFDGLNKNEILKANSTKEVVVSLTTIQKEGWGRNFNDELLVNISYDDSLFNPNTSVKDILVVLTCLTFITGVLILSVKSRKLSRYAMLLVMFGTLIGVVKAKEILIVPIKINVSYESQNVMKKAYVSVDEDDMPNLIDYWAYGNNIKDVYIENEIKEPQEYVHKFDVSIKEDGKVIAYLIENKDEICSVPEGETYDCYNLHLQANGVIYPNEDASYYFYNMIFFSGITNLEGLDASEVKDMRFMFANSSITDDSDLVVFDIGELNTSSVINMEGMFYNFALDNRIFELLNVDGFNTSNVENMNDMFAYVGYYGSFGNLEIGDLDTSKVTSMNSMFRGTCNRNHNFQIDVSVLETGNVTSMSYMFSGLGEYNEKFLLDLSNFDTSNVTDMRGMFYRTGYNSTEINTSITISNPDVLSYDSMFYSFVTKDGSKIIVNYTSETESLVDEMIATKTDGANVFKGKMIVDVDNLSTGDEVHISGEKFNVVSQNDDTITLLTKYNLGTDYRQSTSENYVVFANNTGWEYSTGKNEIDISVWSSVVNTYINEYVDYISNELSDDSVTGDLMTLKQLSSLGCVIPTNYEYVADSNGRTCSNSEHIGWINNNQRWWTKSAVFDYPEYVWIVGIDNHLGVGLYNYSRGIRPTITISKESLKEYVGV